VDDHVSAAPGNARRAAAAAGPAGDVDLAGQVAFVTGGGAGIGRAASSALAAAGAAVHVADRDPVAAEAVAAEVRAAGGRAWAHACDVADERSVAATSATVEGVSGRLDVLVANAGVFPKVALRDTTPDVFDHVMAVNVRGPFLCVMAALPLLERSGGSVVVLSSGAGTLASIAQPMARSLPVYGASKAAVDRWALGIAPELAEAGVAVNVLWPGAVVRTAGTAALGYPPDELAAGIDPADVAPAVVLLAAQRPDGPAGRDLVGRQLKAVDLGTTWGPGAPP
jgi:NAD(P)-dependent dehydrogenase (short-subunit alcohol dehydrogenase family)